MSNTNETSAETQRQIQNAFRFSLAMAISMLLITIILLITGGLPKALLDLTTFAILVTIAAIISTWLSRHGQHALGIILLITSLLLACTITAYLLSGMGAVLAIVALLISFGAGTASLPRRQANIVNVISITLALSYVLLDVFEPLERQASTQPGLTWAFTGVLTLVFGAGILRNFGQYSFRTKLIISFITITIVSVGLIAVFNFNTTTNLLTETSGRELSGIASTQAQRVSDLLNEQLKTMAVLALDEILQEGIEANIQAYEGDKSSILAEIEQLDQQWRAANAADNTNDPLIVDRLTNQSARELRAFKDTFPDNLEIFVTDQYGALIGSTNITSDYYQADEDWWQAAYNNGAGAIYIGNPEFDESVGETSIQIAIPVVDKTTGQVSGVLRSTYAVDPIFQILSEEVGETGETDLYIPEDPPFHFHEGKYEPVEPELYNQLVETADQSYTQFVYEDIESFVSQAPVRTLEGNPAVDNLGWFVALHQHADEVLGAVQTQTRTALGLVIVILGVAVGAAAGLAQILVNPVARLTATAQEIAAGDLSIEAEVTTQDEVGILAQNFNIMTAQLRSILAGLEERVAARTRDLELAAEVGQRLSLVRDTASMLIDAVDVIRERFDLYYTQVYLTDPAGRALVLQAGTGEVGQTLLRRAHRLPLDMGSLNGIAATERRTVLVEDTETSPIHRPNPLLPKTRSEMAIPLIVRDRVVGVLDMQSSQPGALSPENQAAFEALAAQLAIAIANAELFEEAERARRTVEEQSRRLTTSGWQDFLDAIERSERLAFHFDRQDVTPLPEPLPVTTDASALVAPVQVAGTSVGKLQFKRERGWTEDEYAIVNSVAQQMAQQIENLRLLAQAEQYRSEAQEALRRLTREGWEEYEEQLKGAQLGYTYSDYEVKPLEKSKEQSEEVQTYPIQVQDQTIGYLEVSGAETLPEDDIELITYINEQLGSHLENLRLSAQTEQALNVTEEQAQRLAMLNELSEQLTTAENLEQILNITSRYMNRIVSSDRTSITWPTADGQALEVFALQGEAGAIPTGTQLPLEGTATGTAFTERRVIRISDLAKSDYLENARLAEQGLRSSMSVPLLTTDRTLGTLNFGSQDLDAFDNRDRDLAIQAASLIAGIIQNQELFAQTQQALAETEELYQGSEQLVRARNYDEILEVLVQATRLQELDLISLMLADTLDSTGNPESFVLVSNWSKGTLPETIPAGTHLKIDNLPMARNLKPGQATLIPDYYAAGLSEESLERVRQTGARGAAVLPLYVGDQMIGFITAASAEVFGWSEADVRQAMTFAGQAATAIQNQLLYEQTQARAQHEQTLREITTEVYAAPDAESILRRAAEEISKRLGLEAFVYLEKPDETLVDASETTVSEVSEVNNHE